MTLPRLLLVALALAATACGPFVSSEPLNAPARPLRAKHPADVPLITQKPDRPFVEVSMLHISSDRLDWSSGTLLQKLRAYGAKQGCDAVLVVGRSDTTQALDSSQPAVGYMGSCLQFLDARDAATPSRQLAAE